jgi:hypothetical protein
MKVESVSKLFTLINTTNFLKYLLKKQSLTTILRFVYENICIEGDSNGSKSSYAPLLHSYIWMSYSNRVKCEYESTLQLRSLQRAA